MGRGEVLDEVRLVKRNHARAELAASDSEQTWRRVEVSLHRKRPGGTDLWPTREQAAAHLKLSSVPDSTRGTYHRVLAWILAPRHSILWSSVENQISRTRSTGAGIRFWI